MMLWQAWLFVGTVAVLATGVAVFTDDDAVAIVSGCVGTVLWFIWAFGALNVEVITGGSADTLSMPVLTFVGAGLGVIPAYIALTGPVDIVHRWREGDTRNL